MREQAARATADGPPAIVPAPRLAPTEASRRWAALLQQIFEVDPLACPTCHGAMRIVACITQASVIDQILTHLRTRASRAVLPEVQREFSTDGAITAGGSPGQRVVSVNDVYPRYGGGLEALLAQETATGWMYRRYTATRNLSGIQSVVRLDASGDIVLLGVLEGGGAGFRITSWRIPAEAVRREIVPYAPGRGTPLANLGNDMTDFPRIFAIGGDSVATVWYASARQAPSTGATLDMSMG